MTCGALLKKQKNVEPRSQNRSEEGDAYIYTCIKRNTYFFVAFSVGKWTQETCERMIEKIPERTKHPSPHTKIEIFTDGNDDYTYVLPDYYENSCINYAQLVKIRVKGKVIGKEKRTMYGNPDPCECSIQLLQFYWNFINEFKRRTSPAMLEELTDHLWSWHEFFYPH